MTREEEIQFKKQVKNETVSRKDELIDAAKRNAAIISEFIRGAEYADQHPKKGLWDAEKVCKYLEEHAGNFMELENDEEGELRSVFYQKGLVDNLRKAMDED